MFFKWAAKGNLSDWQPSIPAAIYIRDNQSPLCPALYNHCYPCRGNCKWVSLLSLYMDDLSPSENCTGSVWSIETHPHPRVLWLPLGVSYCIAFGDEGKKKCCFAPVLLLYALCTICDLFSLSPPLFGLCSLSLLLLFEGSSPSPRFLSRPSNLFLPLQDKCYVRGLCFPPSPSQCIYDVSAVRAISQGRGIQRRSGLGWTVVSGVHHKYFGPVYTFSH